MDPVRLEVVWQALLAVTDEAAWVLTRTAFSNAVREAWDFGVSLYDGRGRLLCQNTAVAGKNGLWHSAAAEVVRRFGPDRVGEGDVFITNQPDLSDGHLFDVCIVRPLFSQGRLIAFVECVEHLVEVGGALNYIPRDLHEEGLIIPLSRIVQGGVDNEELIALIKANVRTPLEVMGDIQAMLAAASTSRERLLALLAKHRLADLDEVANEIIARTEAATRRGIERHLRPGRYENAVTVDSGEGPLVVAGLVVVGQDGVRVDFAGSSPQCAIGINSPINFTYAWAAYAVKCLVEPELPANHGCFAPISISAPEGTVVNPRPDAPVRSRGVIGVQVPDLIFGALSTAVAGGGMAASCAPSWAVRCYWTDPSGRHFSEGVALNGGSGAQADRDGASCLPFPNNAANTSVEVMEEILPVQVLERSLRPGSGGMGRQRGGLGQIQRLRIAPGAEVRVVVQTNQIQNPPGGREGGGAGWPGAVLVNNSAVPGNSALSLVGGDVLEMRLPGGGGFGAPDLREPAAVEADLLDALIAPGEPGQ